MAVRLPPPCAQAEDLGFAPAIHGRDRVDFTQQLPRGALDLFPKERHDVEWGISHGRRPRTDAQPQIRLRVAPLHLLGNRRDHGRRQFARRHCRPGAGRPRSAPAALRARPPRWQLRRRRPDRSYRAGGVGSRSQQISKPSISKASGGEAGAGESVAPPPPISHQIEREFQLRAAHRAVSDALEEATEGERSQLNSNSSRRPVLSPAICPDRSRASSCQNADRPFERSFGKPGLVELEKLGWGELSHGGLYGRFGESRLVRLSNREIAFPAFVFEFDVLDGDCVGVSSALWQCPWVFRKTQTAVNVVRERRVVRPRCTASIV